MNLCCLHPDIIINPLASELIAEHANYTIRGKEFKLSNRNLLYDFKVPFISPKKQKIKREDIDSCFISNRFNGEHYPLYLEVPCGHCECCKNAKINAFVHRCKLETQLYDSLPIFLTLTYNEKNRPKDGVSVRDVQLFFKRLRINLQRKGYREKIRYVLVAEYGQDPRFSRRPHYHAILWNLHASDILDYRQILETVQKSWNLGYVCSRFIQPDNDKGFFYTAKYLCKDLDVPESQRPTFCLSSRRGGGIGSGFVDLIACHIARTLDTLPKFCNKFNGRCEPVQLSRYVLNRALPSFSRSLSPGLKKSVREFLLCYKQLKSIHNYDVSDFDQTAKDIIDMFGQFFYCPMLETSEIKPSMVRSPVSCIRTCLFEDIKIRQALKRGKEYYLNAERIDKIRHLYLDKMFSVELPDRPLENIAYIFRRSMAAAKQREIL